jgi:hypothetical protein
MSRAVLGVLPNADAPIHRSSKSLFHIASENFAELCVSHRYAERDPAPDGYFEVA